MDPNLQNGEENPYDFIFRPDQNAPVVAKGMGNKNKQIIMFAVFLVVVLIVVGIVLSVLSSASKPKANEAIAAEAYQTEIARIIDLGEKNIAGPALQQKAITLNLILLDDQKKVAEVIKNKGIKVTPAQLAQYKDAKRDDQLTQSLQNNRYDETFEKMVDDLFTKYYQAVKDAEKASTTKKEKDTLNAVRKHVETVYEKASNTTSNNADANQSGNFQSTDNIQN